MSLKRVILLVYVQVMVLTMYSQDFQFSQFYATPMLMNPAFTGNTVQSRITGNYRNQWSAVPNSIGFNTYAFGYEHNFENFNSGIGLQFIHDRAGQGALRTTAVLLSYAYRIRMTRKFSIKPGLQFGLGNRSIDFNELVFNDQLQTGATTSAAQQDFNDKSRYYLDLNAGAIGYGKYYWVGFSIHHLNKPDIALMGNGIKLDMKYSVHGGYKFPIKKDIKKRLVSAFTLTANYKHQGKRDQLDFGGYFSYSPILFGLWYRGLPVKNIEANLPNNDAIIVLVGYSKNGFTLGYSYDLTVSKLTAATSGGAHEISVSLEMASRKSQRQRRRRSRLMIPCPKF
ncbi:MAG: hypothetical protein CL840_06105 [Crocinitomicaceae bacterium]|nr:hypothetical protein [Crocinitomicaceae bacterium]|tara:strand:- start:3402 stop:4421 length:1020 start_codon:yes stop_codon:yes gene_type:complete